MYIGSALSVDTRKEGDDMNAKKVYWNAYLRRYEDGKTYSTDGFTWRNESTDRVCKKRWYPTLYVGGPVSHKTL
jgi:hypothetical protein